MQDHADRLTRKAFLVALTPVASCTTPFSQPAPPNWLSDFVDLFYRRKEVRRAFETHVAENYIQHSRDLADGRDAAIAVLEPMFRRDSFRAEPVRSFCNGDLAVVLLHVTVGEYTHALVVDIFRVENERIVEHWDIKTEVAPEDAAHFFQGLLASSLQP